MANNFQGMEDDVLFEAQRIKGQQLKREADSILTRSIYFGNKSKDAVNKYKEAAEHFMTGLDNKSAIDCYTAALNVWIKNQKILNHWKEPTSFLYAEAGKFYKSGELEKELAEYIEVEGLNFENEKDKDGHYMKAIEHYKHAGETFELENAKTSTNQCYVKAAELSGLIENYEDAIKYFEIVAARCSKEKLTAFNAREHLMKALLCHILLQMKNAEKDDLTGAFYSSVDDLRNAYDRYCEMDIYLSGSLEGDVVLKLFDAIQRRNPKEMATVLRKFDSLKVLDSWKTTILLKIKDNISTLDLT
ncbi:hypothetical protein C9374_001140 [Naegleria lovaniensis]|uniref:Alpha-soluble NSF attachment protein n=1 Tax=Naegleria lovaniensis TaxID=51637 RepID=A0AA88GX49_NAELO|nr:uncharacterized protein C9374_001140 [Naegleria lovaniensis]KAG2387546.1 hypothetical protein C9374_001140 [Naegleria lovaniensis]